MLPERVTHFNTQGPLSRGKGSKAGLCGNSSKRHGTWRQRYVIREIWHWVSYLRILRAFQHPNRQLSIWDGTRLQGLALGVYGMFLVSDRFDFRCTCHEILSTRLNGDFNNTLLLVNTLFSSRNMKECNTIYIFQSLFQTKHREVHYFRRQL